MSSPRRLLAVAALAVIALGGVPAAAQTPPTAPDGGPAESGATYIERALQTVRTRDVGGGVQLQEWLHRLGVMLWGAFALMIVAWQAIQIALGGRFEIVDFVKLMLLIGVPRMMLDGFWTPYAVFGNQTFVEVVTNQGRAMAAALNGGPIGGPWKTTWDQLIQSVGTIVKGFLEIVVINLQAGGIVDALRGLVQTVQLSILGGLLVIFGLGALLVVGLALVLVYVQVLWAEVAVGLMALTGPVFVPFLLIDQLAFLFWSWLKAILQYSLQVFVGGMMMLLIGSLAGEPMTAIVNMVNGISPVPGDAGVAGINADLVRDLVLPIMQWFPLILCCLFMSLKVGEFTAALVSGMGAPTSGMAGVALAAMTAGKSVALRAGAMAARRFGRGGV